MADSSKDDVLLRIKALDDGATDLLNRLLVAQRNLTSARSDGNKNGVAASKRQITAVRKELTAYREATSDELKLLRQRLSGYNLLEREARKSARVRVAAELQAYREIAQAAKIVSDALKKEARDVALAVRKFAAEKAKAERDSAAEIKKTALDAKRAAAEIAKTERAAAGERKRAIAELAAATRRGIAERAKAERAAIAEQNRNDRATIAAAKTVAREQAKATRDRIKAEQEATRSVQRGLAAEVRAARAAAVEKGRNDRATIAAARTVAREQAKASREQAKAARDTARAVQKALADEVRASKAAAREKEKASRDAARVAREAIRLQRQQTAGLADSSAAALRLGRSIIAVVTAYAGFRQIQSFIAIGLKFNQTLETASLGIASLIFAESTLTTSNGKTVDGIEGLNVALGLAASQVLQLRIAGIQTAATTEQLVDAYQQAVGAGIRVGLTLDQIRQFTVRAVQAAYALGVPMNQLNQEVRSILDGTIDRNSRVAKALQLSNAEVRLAREHGQLAQFLDDRFKSFEVTGTKAVKTFAVLKSNMVEALAVFAGASTKPLFESLRDVGGKALATIFDFDSANIADKFTGLVTGFKLLFAAVGRELGDAIQLAVQYAEELSTWFKNNKEQVESLAVAMGVLARSVVELAAGLISVPVALSRSASEVGVLAAGVKLVASFLRAVKDNLLVISALLTGAAIKKGISFLIFGATPVGQIIAALLTITTLYEFLKGQLELAALAGARRAAALGAETAEAIALITQYRFLTEKLRELPKASKEYIETQTQLRVLGQQLIDIGGPYADVIRLQGTNAEEAAKSFEKLIISQAALLTTQLATAAAAVQALEAQKIDAENQLELLAGQDEAYIGQAALIEGITSRLAAQRATVQAVADALNKVNIALLDAQSIQLATTKPKIEPKTSKKLLDDESQLQEGILTLLKARVKQQTELVEGMFTRLQITEAEKIQKIYELKLELIDQEIRVREARKLATEDEGELDRLREEITAFEEQRVTLKEALKNDLFDSAAKLTEFRAKIAGELLSADSDKVLAKARELAATYHDALETAFREQDFETVLAINRIIDIGVAREQADELVRIEQRAAAKLEATINRIQFKVQTGAIQEQAARLESAKAYEEYVATVSASLPEIQRLVDLFKDIDPDVAQTLENIADKIKKTGQAARDARNKWKQFNQEVRASIESQLGQGIDDLISGTKSLGEAFSSVASSIVSDIIGIISHMIALKIVQAALGSFGLAAGGPVPTPGAATGGMITGPGTGTSDSILARLSAGEFVMTARAVNAYGPDFFHSLNRSVQHSPVKRGGHRFASGGIVPPPAQGGSRAEFSAELGLAPDLVVRHLKSSNGVKAMLGAIAQNRQSFKSAMGI